MPRDYGPHVLQRIKWSLLLGTALLFFVTSFFWQSPGEILAGLIRINLDPSPLITDYIVIGGLGAALWNSGLIILLGCWMIHMTRARLVGTLMAAVIMVAGFAFFGTNVFNVLPIIGGAWLYARFRKQRFGSVILAAFFGTALGPLVSILAFDLTYPLYISLPLSLMVGVLIGFATPALSGPFLRFHSGYTLYNIGFVAGVLGIISVSILRAYGHKIDSVSILSVNRPWQLTLLLIGIFSFMTIVGLFLNGWSLKGYGKLLGNSGRLVADFDILYGTALTLFNMGLMGFIAIVYVYLVDGPMNGAVVGGILSVAGFAAMGKHPRNTIPVMLGVLLATYTSPVMNHSNTSAVITALFATALAPIAGEYGFFAGVLAGFLHTTFARNVLGTHGGVNLYNNGFSTGFVAAALVPLLRTVRDRKEDREDA